MRATLVFLLALLAGTVAGGLTVLAGEGAPRSLLAGLAVVGLAVPFFNRLIDTEGGGVQPPGPAGAGAGASSAEGESNG
ncbi:hypothetical protein [Streptomyces sp. NPDC001507]|uniref:hypothetical protein n=1 Tax=Streptomyces sp. NPDC001507 TaxID=3364579 RepID=UPI0036C0003E